MNENLFHEYFLYVIMNGKENMNARHILLREKEKEREKIKIKNTKKIREKYVRAMESTRKVFRWSQKKSCVRS